MQFNEKLKKLRLEKGITQAELAENVFVSRSAVAKWENGLGLPSGESLALLAEYFGVDKAELLSDPETATVIIHKNNALSKQKVSIIALVALSLVLIIVAAVLIPFATRNHDLPAPVTQELIFETEKDIELEATNYSDNNLSADKYFAASRTFTYNSRNERIPLPKLLFKQTLGDEISYTEVAYKDVSFSKSYGCSLQYDENEDMLYVVAENAEYGEEQNGCANIVVGDEHLSLKIQDVPIPVESVQLLKYDMYADLEVQVNGSIALSSLIYPVVFPDDATYKDTYFGVEKIVKADGTTYEGNIEEYYRLMLSGFSGKCTMTVYKDIEPGSKIYVFAETSDEHVRSNLIEITVTRIPVKYINVYSDKTAQLQLGETCHFYAVAYDRDATFNVLGEVFTVTLLTPELATLSGDGNGGYILTALPDNGNVHKRIEVEVSTPEGIKTTRIWTIQAIFANNMLILNADTGDVIYGELAVKSGSVTALQVCVMPANANYLSIKYICEDNEYITVSADGVITVSVAAPHGFTQAIDVVVDEAVNLNNVSRHINITVENIEQVILKSEYSSLYKGVINTLSVDILPADTPVHSIEYVLLDTGVDDEVILSGNRLIASANAQTGKYIYVMAIVDGTMRSNILRLKIENPPTDITNYRQTMIFDDKKTRLF